LSPSQCRQKQFRYYRRDAGTTVEANTQQGIQEQGFNIESTGPELRADLVRGWTASGTEILLRDIVPRKTANIDFG
jgi:hypothetical protein